MPSPSLTIPRPGLPDGRRALREVPLEQWLSAKQVAAHFALQEDSAYRWRDEGTIPAEYVKRCGRMRFLLHPDVIPLLEKVFEQAHE